MQAASKQGEGDAREMRRLASAAFGGAGRGDGFHFGCPECAHPITVEPSAAGARIACPECGARIDVPDVAPGGHGSGGGGVTRPASLPHARSVFGSGETQEVPAGIELRQAHDDQHRLNPDRKVKFVPFEGTVAPAYDAPGRRGAYAGPNRGPGWIRTTLGILGVVALGVGIYVFLSRAKGRPKDPATLPVGDSLSAETSALMDFYGEFRAALSPDSRAAFVRHPEITLPRIVNYYQLRGIDPPSPMLLPHTAVPVTEGGIPFIRCDAQFKSRKISAYFEKTATGGFLVDWESLMGYSRDEWGLFVASVPSDPQEFRAFIAADEFFGDEFPDPAKSSCARIYHLDGSHDLYGYVERDSALDEVMKELVRQAKSDVESPVPCRVRVRFVRPGKNAKQVEILSLAPGWLVPVEVAPEPEPATPPAREAVPADIPGAETSLRPESDVPSAPGSDPLPEDAEIPRAERPDADTKTEVIPSAIPLDR